MESPPNSTAIRTMIERASEQSNQFSVVTLEPDIPAGEKNIKDYCRIMQITDSNGVVRELVFPKALDLDRPKRARTSFSAEQLFRLENEFVKNQYLVGRDRAELARRLGLSETQVKVWYQNRRTKHKRDKDRDDVDTNTSFPDASYMKLLQETNEKLQQRSAEEEKERLAEQQRKLAAIEHLLPKCDPICTQAASTAVSPTDNSESSDIPLKAGFRAVDLVTPQKPDIQQPAQIVNTPTQQRHRNCSKVGQKIKQAEQSEQKAKCLKLEESMPTLKPERKPTTLTPPHSTNTSPCEPSLMGSPNRGFIPPNITGLMRLPHPLPGHPHFLPPTTTQDFFPPHPFNPLANLSLHKALFPGAPMPPMDFSALGINPAQYQQSLLANLSMHNRGFFPY